MNPDSFSIRKKPLPLKQRTTSVDPRRDYSAQTWTSVLALLKIREYFITIDHFSIWRRHLAWAFENGKDLRDYMTQRYASSMVFMSLLLSTELGVLFNSAGVTTNVRLALMEERHGSISFWAGMAVIISAILTLLSLISTFTAWTMVSAVSDANAHCVFRSSIGQYVAELPGRFIVCSIYSFVVWLSLFFFLLLPIGFWSFLLLLVVFGLFIHTITAFSAFGRVIMHSGAMGSQSIFESSYEANLLPHSLHSNLLAKARANLANNMSIRRQYRSEQKPMDRPLSEDDVSLHISERSLPSQNEISIPETSNEHSLRRDSENESSVQIPVPPRMTRRRTSSSVKFADGFDTNGDRVEDDKSISHSCKGIQIATTNAPVPLPLPRASFEHYRPPRPTISRDSHAELQLQVKGLTDVSGPGTNGPSALEKWLSSTCRNEESANDVVDMEAQESSPDGRPRLPSQTSLTRSVSSSLEGQDLTEEEKFDLEYGDFSYDNCSCSSDGGGNDDYWKDHGETTSLLHSNQCSSERYQSTKACDQRLKEPSSLPVDE